MVTTDGHRLSKAEFKQPEGGKTLGFSMLVPSKGIAEFRTPIATHQPRPTLDVALARRWTWHSMIGGDSPDFDAALQCLVIGAAALPTPGCGTQCSALRHSDELDSATADSSHRSSVAPNSTQWSKYRASADAGHPRWSALRQSPELHSATNGPFAAAVRGRH